LTELRLFAAQQEIWAADQLDSTGHGYHIAEYLDITGATRLMTEDLQSGVGLGRAALIAADEDAESGLPRLVDALALEMRMLISAVGRYAPAELAPQDLWFPGGAAEARQA
jgi:hypothetical protein